MRYRSTSSRRIGAVFVAVEALWKSLPQMPSMIFSIRFMQMEKMEKVEKKEKMVEEI